MHCLRLANCQVYFSTVRDHLPQRERTMGKPLVFAYGNADLSFDPTKIDRSDLYGFKETGGSRRTRPTLRAGHAGRRRQDGRGPRRRDLRLPGARRRLVRQGRPEAGRSGRTRDPARPLVVQRPVPLVEKASLEEYLSHNVRSVYLMQSDGSAVGAPGGTPRRDDLQVPLQLPRRAGGRRRFPARRGRRQRLPGRGQSDQNRVRRPAAGRRHWPRKRAARRKPICSIST